MGGVISRSVKKHQVMTENPFNFDGCMGSVWYIIYASTAHRADPTRVCTRVWWRPAPDPRCGMGLVWCIIYAWCFYVVQHRAPGIVHNWTVRSMFLSESQYVMGWVYSIWRALALSVSSGPLRQVTYQRLWAADAKTTPTEAPRRQEPHTQTILHTPLCTTTTLKCLT